LTLRSIYKSLPNVSSLAYSFMSNTIKKHIMNHKPIVNHQIGVM